MNDHAEIFAFKTKSARALFVADLRRAFPDQPYATNHDPDTSEADRWLVAIPMDAHNRKDQA